MIGANKALSNQRSAISAQQSALKQRGKEQETLTANTKCRRLTVVLVDVGAAIYRDREKHGQQG
jgi:hypothetical protein